MRYQLIFLLSFFLLNIAFAQQDDGSCKDLDAILEREQHTHEALLNFRSSPYTSNYDLKYHRLEWTLDPAVTYIAGTVTSYFEPTEAGFQEINFDLVDALAVFSVTYHGQPLTFTQHPERLQILLPGPIPEGQLDSLSVTYAGAPVATGFGSFNRSTHNNGTPVLWTLSEPYGARDWWPCKLDLNDKIDSIDVIVRTPAQYRTASNGLLVDERTDGNQKIYHWRHRYPIATYLIAVAVTNYAVYSDFVPVPGGSDIEVLNYVYPEQLATIQDQTQATVEVMELFNDLFGLYPFADEKYGHAQFSWGGGMEHQTMSFMGGWSHLLQAHELAHQWFGDKITCGSWEDIWLNEGFATYLEGLTYEHGLGPNTWQGWLQGKINDVTQWPHGSVWVDDTTDVNRIFRYRLTYAKAALLLHMLRWQLGDANFFQAVRNYADDPELAYGYARTADLKGHLEAQSGQDLDEFFADWFYGQGFPSYHLTWWQEAGEVRLMAEQTQSHHTVDFFEMPIPVTFYGAGQDSTLVFDHAFSGQTFTVELPFEVTSIEFNRDLWILYDEATYEETFFTGTAEAVNSDGLRLFPNPARDHVTLEVTDLDLQNARVQLFDGRGRLLRQARLNGERLEIDLSELAAGMYWVKVVTPGREWTGKVVRE